VAMKTATTTSRWRARSFPPWLWPARHCMTRDRLRRRDCPRCCCEEDRVYATSVVLPPRTVVRVPLRLWRDVDPASVSKPPQQGSSFLRGTAFPWRIRRFASPAAQITSCDDYRVG